MNSSENHDNQDENVAVFGDSDLREVVVISGPVFSEVSAVFESGMSEFLGRGLFHKISFRLKQTFFSKFYSGSLIKAYMRF